MARATEEDRLKVWQDRVKTSNKKYEEWEKRYETDRLEDYYLGRQWRGLDDEEASKKYTINMVYSTVEVNKPSMAFYRPQIRIQPRPGRSSSLASTSVEKARLCEDTIQTFIDDPDVKFAMETNLALHEAHFRFGVIEVGYSSDWVDNPNAGKPILKENSDEPLRDSNGEDVLEPERKIEREAMFVRRIPAKQLRVSSSSRNSLEQNDWVAYYEWHYVEDLKRNPVYKNTRSLKATGSMRHMPGDENASEIEEYEERSGMVKVWKLWDMRTMKRHVFAEGHAKFLLEKEPFSFLPLSVMKFHEVLDSFYPMPPVFQWLGPQDELNEIRDSQRAHRRRFYRRYTTMEGAIDEPELEKVQTGGDGVIIKVNMPNALVPVEDAPMGADVWNHLGETKQDLLAVSGIGGDQRGVADSETATQANIIDVRSKLRESSARTRVSEWLSQIARLMLMTIREKMALPFWVKRNVDTSSLEADPMAALQISDLYRSITAEDVTDIDLDIIVDLASMSPVTEETQRVSWNQVIAILTNPTVAQIMAMSPVILRRTLNLYGIRAENDIQEVQRVLTQMMQMAEQAQQQAQMEEAKGEAADAGVVPELIEQAGESGPSGRDVPSGVQEAIDGGKMVG
jgi:hypothetical protein